MNTTVSEPETPLTRRYQHLWTDQTENLDLARRTLLSGKGDKLSTRKSGGLSSIPPPLAPAATVFELGDEPQDSDDTWVSRVNNIAINQMLAGSTVITHLPGQRIFESFFSLHDHQESYPLLFDIRKNRCRTMPSLYAFVVQNDNFVSVSGAELRSSIAGISDSPQLSVTILVW